ncbi:MAG: aminotransferase class III-fold pyridoxal phosphate-dependent enzyme, partial [Odoribacter sp.]|nr:aminotransferase class III-fold pyridoxal phosphate-dependent enzyme [Odoribacter sp.]
FEVYDLLDIEPVEAKGAYLWDDKGEKYLDFYGGHAVISIGHSHPIYVEKISEQVKKLGFYSNAVRNSLQEELAQRLCKISGYSDYKLFLCNSGAEANENALKLASFITGKEKILAIKGAFHGRTSAAVAATDNPSIQAPVNTNHKVTFIVLNDNEALKEELAKKDYAAIIIEGIQGVGGIRVPEIAFLQEIRRYCDETGTIMILDEIQSGYGRSGQFFAHQYAEVKPDIITMAKGMGNGFPIAGLLISDKIEAKKGMLGTTFGGNHLGCAAALAVLDVIEKEYVVNNAAGLGKYLMKELQKVEGVQEVRGYGLMIGVELNVPQSEFRHRLLKEHHILTGYSGKMTLRLLPPLTITRKEADEFLAAFKAVMAEF